jgi:hypothetical protein
MNPADLQPVRDWGLVVARLSRRPESWQDLARGVSAGGVEQACEPSRWSAQRFRRDRPLTKCQAAGSAPLRTESLASEPPDENDGSQRAESREQELLGRGVVEEVMEPRRLSPLKHVRRFALLTQLPDEHRLRRRSSISLRCGESTRPLR